MRGYENRNDPEQILKYDNYDAGFAAALAAAEEEAARQFYVDEASLNRFKFIIDKVRNNYK